MMHNDPCSISPTLILVCSDAKVALYIYLIKEFKTAVLQAYEETKATVTLGVLLTLQPAPAFNFTKPVLIVAGDRD